jgi:chromate transporter
VATRVSPGYTYALRCLFFGISAVGGVNAIVPQVRAAVVGSGWLSADAFARVVTVAQLAPGPNLLYIPLCGWAIARLPAALLALTAFLLPTALGAILAARILLAGDASPRIVTLRSAIAPVAAGILTGAGIALGRAVATTRWIDIAIVVVVATLATWRGNTLRWLALAGVIGAAASFGRFGG